MELTLSTNGVLGEVRTGMWISRALFVACTLWAMPLAAQTRAIEAWWLNATFVPDSLSYMGVRAAEIDPAWIKLAILSESKLPAEAATDLSWMRRDGFQFTWTGKLNDNRVPEHLATGIYLARDGETGRFLAAFTRTPDRAWQTQLIYKQAGSAGFSVLRTSKGRVFWSTCMLCGEVREVKMKNGRVLLW
jgi:hypothetical protein